MRCLVLGGNGFIGSHLVEALHQTGARVRVLDRSRSRYSAPVPGVDYRLGNIAEAHVLAEALYDIDVVFHLASSTVPSTSNLDPSADIRGNLLPAVALLEQMVRVGARRVVFLSSGGTVYGNPVTEPVAETHPLRPICSYGVVKAAIEHYLWMFQHLHGVQAVVLRPSNPYGPRQGHEGVQGAISTFLARVLAGEPIRVWGDGSNTRDYIYVSDLVDLCVRAGASDITGVFNVGSGIGHSINDLLSLIQTASGLKANVIYEPSRPFDVRRITLDSSEARRSFGWDAKIPIEQGVFTHLEWLRSLRPRALEGAQQ